MRSKMIRLIIVLTVTVLFWGAMQLPEASSRGIENSSIDVSLASEITPIGPNFKLPDVPRFAVGGKRGIAFDGANFLVVYNTEMNIYAMRISQQGAILDSPAIPVSIGGSDAVYAPSVVFDGTNFLMVWISSSELYGARLSTAGDVLSPGIIQLTTGGGPLWWAGVPSPVWDGDQLLVTWVSAAGVSFARFSPALVNLDPPAGLVVLPGIYWNSASIAFDGTNYLVAASGNPTQGENGDDIYAARISPDGEVLDAEGFVVYSEPYAQDQARVAFDGVNYLVAWYDYAPHTDAALPGSVLARRVSPAGTLLGDTPIQAARQVFRWGVEAFDLLCDPGDCLVIWASPSNMIRHTDIWGRRVIQGVVQDPQAIPVAATWGQQYWPVVGSGGGHFLVVWTENVFRDLGTYGQMLERQTVFRPTVLPKVAAQPASPSAAGVQPGWFADSITSHGVGGGVAFSIDNSYAISWDYLLGNHTSSWQNVRTLEQRDAGVIWASGPDDIWATGGCNYILHFDGQSWTDYACRFAPSEFGNQIGTSLWGSSPTDIWGTGVQGTLFRYNGAQDWIFQASGISFDLVDLWGTSSDNIYAVGERGSIFRYNGAVWSPQTGIPTIQRLNAAWGSGPNDIYAVGDWGVILHFNGIQWSARSSGTYAHLYGVWGTSASNVYAVGSEGTILHYNGSVWSPENSHSDMDLYAVWGLPGGWPVWAGGSGSQILVREYRTFVPDVNR